MHSIYMSAFYIKGIKFKNFDSALSHSNISDFINAKKITKEILEKL